MITRMTLGENHKTIMIRNFIINQTLGLIILIMTHGVTLITTILITMVTMVGGITITDGTIITEMLT